MPQTEGLFKSEPEKFKVACATRRRCCLAERRAEHFAQTVYAHQLNAWLLMYQGPRDTDYFYTRKRAQEDRLMAQAFETRAQGARQIYRYLAYEPFDERVGFLRPAYAVCHHSSTTAPRDPS